MGKRIPDEQKGLKASLSYAMPLSRGHRKLRGSCSRRALRVKVRVKGVVAHRIPSSEDAQCPVVGGVMMGEDRKPAEVGCGTPGFGVCESMGDTLDSMPVGSTKSARPWASGLISAVVCFDRCFFAALRSWTYRRVVALRLLSFYSALSVSFSLRCVFDLGSAYRSRCF
ncbi:hypothetical protein LZ30DRAFT_20091 [Colletotrichum cereale]|nr:hypothetical protein LZ30DRAFT_20091 [Colletotrichum cereale]